MNESELLDFWQPICLGLVFLSAFFVLGYPNVEQRISGLLYGGAALLLFYSALGYYWRQRKKREFLKKLSDSNFGVKP